MPKFIPTAQSLRHQARRLDRQARRLNRHGLRAEQVVAELQRGATLQLSYEPRPLWRLSSGQFVPEQTALAVIALPNVVGDSDALLAGELSQTFHYVEGREEIAP